MTTPIPEYIDGLPTIAGREPELESATRAAAKKEVFRPESSNRLRPDQERFRHRAAHAPAADPGRRR